MKEKIEFTPSQQRAVEKIKNFMALKTGTSLESRVFRLTGPAGTGKSFIIRYALQELIDQDIANGSFESFFGSNNVLGVTLSHKAKNILYRSIPACKTFASTFGLKPVNNPDGTQDFIRQKTKDTDQLPCEMPYKVFVHDEFSMYNQQMLDYTLKYTHPYSKIIFVGDICQNPPILSSKEIGHTDTDMDSPVLYLNLPDSNTEDLKEIVRQEEGNPIIELAAIMRNEIMGSHNLGNVIQAMKNISFDETTGIGFKNVAYSDFLNIYKEEDYRESKVVAYRNKTVDTFNDAVRKFVLNNPDKAFIADEIIYMNDTFTKLQRSEPSFTLYNSDEYEIESVIEDSINDVSVLKLMIKPESHRHLEYVRNPFVPVPVGKGKKDYDSRLFLISRRAKDPQLSAGEKSKEWGKFFSFKEKFGNVSYGYCYTGHKIQGSTIRNVYVDVNDILTVGPISDKRKIQALYTAITRATHKVSLLRSRG